MNDPGVDGPIHEAAQDVENNVHESKPKNIELAEEEDEHDYLNPSRWWFASTACPLIAGTFGPMANAFSICALVENWRVYIPPGGTEEHGEVIRDPGWLIAVNAISLVCALIANFALLLNMTRRLSFAVAQSITIIGWFVSAFLLIALVSAASTILQIPPATEHALTQAFYYAIMAAALYCIISILMCVTVYGAYRGHYEKDFKLTVSQRTLMLQTISFMAYLLLGALVFSKIEGWAFLDGVYWADFTLLTIGIGGEYVPKTHTGRGLLFPYAIGGIVTLGLVIGSIRSLVLERGKNKMKARLTEKKRQAVLKSIDTDKGKVRISLLQGKQNYDADPDSEADSRRQEFEIMRQIQSRSENNRRWMALGFSTLAAFILWLVGAAVFMLAERNQNWTYFQSMYFAYTSLLTVGYGDFVLMGNSGKPFFVFWSLMAVPTLTVLISNMGDTVVKVINELTNWLGSLTVLPGEQGVRKTVRRAVEAGIGRARSQNGSSGMSGQKNGVGAGAGAMMISDDDPSSEGAESAWDPIEQIMEKEELEEAMQACREGDSLERDIHFYHFVLVREIRNVMRDKHAPGPGKKYSYEEWKWYLRLLGEDEGDAERHHEDKDRTKRTERGSGDSAEEEKGGASSEEENELKREMNGNMSQWSWLSKKSPLMGHKGEAEWILERLTLTLERELRRQRAKDEKGRRKKPPISVDELVRKRSRG